MHSPPASSLVYPERATAPPNVLLSTPWAESALQESGPVFSLELMLYLCPLNQALSSSGVWGLPQAAAVFSSDALSGTSSLHCGGI